jgi:hypothetical protein
MFEWTLSNTQLILTGLVCVVLIGTAVAISGRREIVRLRDAVKELSGRVNALEMIEQRRFMQELKSKVEAPTVAPTAEIVSLSEAGTSRAPPGGLVANGPV